MRNMKPIIVVHGGAGSISDSVAERHLQGVKYAAKESYKVLRSGASVLDAVEAAVRILEDDDLYNAGKGSVLNLEGEVEMDASIMVGSDLSAGAVTVVKDIKNPISLARKVMENTSHVLLAAHGAKKFAKSLEIEILPPGALVIERRKSALEKLKKERTELGETVGAVAVDSEGHVAAATSTGGRDGKMVGRSSDTCIIGSGTYADDYVGAVSTTGHGETIAKFCLAHSIIKSMEAGKSAQDATTYCIQKMTERLKNTAGAITVSKDGEVGIDFSTERMSWAYQQDDKLHFGINKNQHEIETCNN